MHYSYATAQAFRCMVILASRGYDLLVSGWINQWGRWDENCTVNYKAETSDLNVKHITTALLSYWSENPFSAIIRVCMRI